MSESESKAGLNIIRRVYEICLVDEQWSVWDERGYTWWGHRLAQRLWVGDPIEDEEFVLYPLHARTELLRDVEPTQSNLAVLAEVNAAATYGAVCLDPETGIVFAHTRYNCHADNHDLAEVMFKPAAALQIAHAHAVLDEMHEQLGGTPCYSDHPTSGRREEPDDMLNVATAFQAAGLVQPEDFYDEFARLVEIGKRISVETNFGPDGLTAEFMFNDKLEHPLAKGMPMTALFRLKTNQPHPLLGSGLLARLDLPCLEARPEIANELNLQASRLTEIENMLGAWTCDERTLHHQVFIPNLSLKPGLAMNCFMYGFNRCEWSSQICEEKGLIDRALNASPKKADKFTEFMLQVAREAGPGASRDELKALVLSRLGDLPDGYFDSKEKEDGRPEAPVPGPPPRVDPPQETSAEEVIERSRSLKADPGPSDESGKSLGDDSSVDEREAMRREIEKRIRQGIADMDISDDLREEMQADAISRITDHDIDQALRMESGDAQAWQEFEKEVDEDIDRAVEAAESGLEAIKRNRRDKEWEAVERQLKANAITDRIGAVLLGIPFAGFLGFLGYMMVTSGNVLVILVGILFFGVSLYVLAMVLGLTD